MPSQNPAVGATQVFDLDVRAHKVLKTLWANLDQDVKEKQNGCAEHIKSCVALSLWRNVGLCSNAMCAGKPCNLVRFRG